MARDIDQVGVLRSQPPSADTDGQLARLQFELTQAQQKYATAARSFQELRTAEAQAGDILAVVDPATPATKPVQPRILINVLVAAVLGLLLAGSAGALVEKFDDRVSSPSRVSRSTGLTVLGTVPARSNGAFSFGDRRFGAPSRSRTGYVPDRASEPFRILSAALQVMSTSRPLRSVLITSSWKGEGKTSIAANLAVVLAQSGKEVVLVDADLRAPSLHQLFDVEDVPGLTSLLLDDHQQVAHSLVRTHVNGLRLLVAGPVPPDPSELLASARMTNKLKALTQLADVVIIDSSPVLEVSDPVVLARSVDGVLLVANARRTRGRHAGEVAEALRNAGAWVCGVVLNHVPDRPTSPDYAGPQVTQPLLQ
jgi:non-specific protein-tyrosine kinase